MLYKQVIPRNVDNVPFHYHTHGKIITLRSKYLASSKQQVANNNYTHTNQQTTFIVDVTQRDRSEDLYSRWLCSKKKKTIIFSGYNSNCQGSISVGNLNSHTCFSSFEYLSQHPSSVSESSGAPGSVLQQPITGAKVRRYSTWGRPAFTWGVNVATLDYTCAVTQSVCLWSHGVAPFIVVLFMMDRWEGIR